MYCKHLRSQGQTEWMDGIPIHLTVLEKRSHDIILILTQNQGNC